MWKINSPDGVVVSMKTVADGPEADTTITQFFDQLDQVVH
jgi:hypothetical protein